MNTTDAATSLTAAIERLRTEHGELTTASRRLLAYGIESHTAEVRDRLAEITDEAWHLANHLRVLGADEAATAALDYWATLIRAHRPAVTP